MDYLDWLADINISYRFTHKQAFCTPWDHSFALPAVRQMYCIVVVENSLSLKVKLSIYQSISHPWPHNLNKPKEYR